MFILSIDLLVKLRNVSCSCFEQLMKLYKDLISEVEVYLGLRNVEMNTLVSRFKVACHHLSGKYIASPGLRVHS